VLVARDRDDAVAALRARDPRRVLTGREVPTGARSRSCSPGLGEQYVGMGRGLYRAEPVFREEIDRCAAVLRPLLGVDLREVLYPPEEEAAAAPAPRRPASTCARCWGATRPPRSPTPQPTG
jgi:acyl transferase domain-containing protein